MCVIGNNETRARAAEIAASSIKNAKGSTSSTPSTCFTCTRLNSTTFVVVEDDKWSELPFIYAKVYPSVLVLIDTGCGGASRDPSVELTSLRSFLETSPVADNGDQPLNPGGQKSYVVLCTHCHYDHIGAIAQFGASPSTAIWASAYDRDFIEGEGRLPTSSLCRFFGMDTPEYEVTNWARDGQHVVATVPSKSQNTGNDLTKEEEEEEEGTLDLGLVIYQTPGHTPDEIAVWDAGERVLFVGDTLYEWARIVFPLEGDLRLYNATLARLREFVQGWNVEAETEAGKERVTIACGHTTRNSDAAELLADVDGFFYQIIQGTVEPKDEGTFRDERVVSFDRADGKVSFIGPKKLFDEFRNDGDAMTTITRRHL